MNEAELLRDGFERVRQGVHASVDNLSEDQLAARIDGRANSIAWLVWHLTRVQDDHLAGVAGHEQVWLSDGWHERFGLPFDPDETGYGQSSDEVDQVRVSAELLTSYYDAVHQKTLDFVASLSGSDLDRVVDEQWDPPVTLGVRLVSVISDDLQHVGQAMYARGLL